MRSAGRVLALLAVLTAVAASGCTPTTQGSARTTPAEDSSAVVKAAVDQFRDGYATGTIVLQLTDAGGSEFTAVRAELSDPRFAPGTVWTGSTRFSPGQTTSLPATVTQPVCSSTGASPAHDAEPSVRVQLADGTEQLVRAEDSHAVLARIHADGCFAAMAASAVTLAFDDTLEAGAQPGSAVLTLRASAPARTAPSSASPSGSSPSGSSAAGASPNPSPPVLQSVGGTTLLDEDRAQPWPRGVVLRPGAAVPLVVRAARCDAHAVAEDKVGTLIPLTLSAAGQTGVVKVAASAPLRRAIYSFVASACGWPAG
jgi:type II secretory pathway pseudopilin PulG